jgi:hypothetical protein
MSSENVSMYSLVKAAFVIALQVNKSDGQTYNVAMFDYCGLRNIHVTPNTQCYPAGDFNAAFTRTNKDTLLSTIQDCS